MYEYKVVPAPVRATKVKGLKTTAERFAHALGERINAEAAGGWEFLRTETLPCEERKGFGGTRSTTQVVMIFGRALGQVRPDASAALAAAQYGEPVYDDTDYAEDLENGAGYAPDSYAPEEPVEEPAWQEPPAPQPAPAPAGGRQEPLFRAGAMLHGDGSRRAEPVLRPRPPSDD